MKIKYDYDGYCFNLRIRELRKQELGRIIEFLDELERRSKPPELKDLIFTMSAQEHRILQKELISEFLEDLINHRGMDFIQLINYLVRLEEKWEKLK